jgi:hypothetical protein
VDYQLLLELLTRLQWAVAALVVLEFFQRQGMEQTVLILFLEL